MFAKSCSAKSNCACHGLCAQNGGCTPLDIAGENDLNDIAKLLLDKGYHAPTIYFPLIVKEALMFEPTETESLDTLDQFADDLIAILAEAEKNPAFVTGAPRTAGGYGINPGDSSFLGSELTAVAGYALTRYAQLEVGYGHFFTGDYVRQSLASTGGDHDADWIYVQTSLKF